MTLEGLLPVVNGIWGGVLLLTAIWALVTGRVVLPREVKIYSELYDRECERSKRLEDLNETMVQELANQNAGHLSSIELLKQIIRVPVPERDDKFTPANNPGRRRDDS